MKSVVLFLVVLAAAAGVQAQCSARTTCETCTVDTACGWCMNTVRGTAECLPGNAAGPTTEWCAEWRFLKSQSGNPVGGFPFNPSELDVFLVTGDDLTIELTFTVPPQDTLPLDIFITQDFSGSMANNIDDLYELIPEFVNGVLEFQFDARFGLAGFVDHRSDTTSGYRNVHHYWFVQELTNNYNLVSKGIAEMGANTANNYDFPETGYDAFLYAAVGGPSDRFDLGNANSGNCAYAGWRDDARKIAIMITDATPKSRELWNSGGNRGGGWTTSSAPSDARPLLSNANNHDCVPDHRTASGYINRNNANTGGEFHPEVSEISRIFREMDIYPIFYTSITSNGYNVRNHLQSHINPSGSYFRRGKWGDLEGATSLSDLVIDALREIAGTVEPTVFSDDGGFYVANSLTTTSNPCGSNILPGCVLTFELDLIRNAGNNNEDDVVVRVPGFGDAAQSFLHVTQTKFFCVGCDEGIPNSVIDYCGVCNGLNASCTDCYGVVVEPGDPIARDDVCGVCEGDGSTCWDCLNLRYDTDPNAHRFDFCGICRAPNDPDWNTTCFDCFWQYNGPARRDDCGVCDGNNDCLGCDGFPPDGNGVVKTFDTCGVCGGDNSTCLGCDGVVYGDPNDLVVRDDCGVCGGDSTTCLGCPGDTVYGPSHPRNLDPPQLDACGVCDGDNSSCFGCDGIRGSNFTLNACSECTDGSTTPTCFDCTGLAFGEAVLDACGVCGGGREDETLCNKSGEDPGAIIGAAVGSTVAVVAMAIIAFLMYMRWKNPNWYYQDALDNLEATQSHNPLYESAGTEKSNPLYTGQ